MPRIAFSLLWVSWCAVIWGNAQQIDLYGDGWEYQGSAARETFDGKPVFGKHRDAIREKGVPPLLTRLHLESDWARSGNPLLAATRGD